MKWPRASGLLAHPSSLPGPYGIGDLGPATIFLLDFLAAARQRLWQVLPLGPTGYGNSPYSVLSAFAGNPLLISPERLAEDGLLAPEDLANLPPFPDSFVDFTALVPWKLALLRAAHARFRAAPSATLAHDFERFRASQLRWLDEYTLFAALKDAHNGAAWMEWERPLATRQDDALADARRQLADDIAFYAFTQFLFFRQWSAVRQAAHNRNIAILGDLAIFVAPDSADVWAHPDLFQLDERGNPTAVSGVPPDYFSATGQRWGNPLYRWDALRQTGYAWWIERVRRALELHDYLRLDHFRGFHAYWEVPADSDTAANGRWAAGPRTALFDAIREALGEVPFLAEDLGQITPGVRALRRRLGFPGMKVLQFGFGGDARNIHLPHNFTPDNVVYTGTHDNDTTLAWFAACGPHERSHILRYLHCAEEEVVSAMIRAASASVARLAIVPLQDALGLGSEARMNVPSHPDGNWQWRVSAGQLTPELAGWLASLSSLYRRS